MSASRYSSFGSNVEAFEAGDKYIIVHFKSGRFRTYTYTYASYGAAAVTQMIALGNAQHGLNSYISRHKPAYFSKS